MKFDFKQLEAVRTFLQHWPALWVGIAILSLVAFYYITRKLTHKLFLRFLTKLVLASKTKWDDHLIDSGALTAFVGIFPLVIAYTAAGWFDGAEMALRLFIKGLIVLQFCLALDRTISGTLVFYQTFGISKKFPIKSYIQLGKLLLWILGLLVTISTWMGESPWVLLSGVGAITAVLLLVFKDTLLSLIAGIQIMTNDLIRVGDWIEVPEFKADGDVIEIALHQIIVSN